MNSTDMLRTVLRDAANAAPDDRGLLAAVHKRSRQRRQRQLATVASLAVVFVVAVLGVVGLTRNAPSPIGNIDPIPSASASAAPMPLVPFRPPTFPYTPTWARGDYEVQYDQLGSVTQFGVTGTELDFFPSSPSTPFTMVFVSPDKPKIGGHPTTVAVKNRPAKLVTGVNVPNYKGDSTPGNVVYWRSASGTWVTLATTPGIFGPLGSPDTALHEAELLVAKPLPITTVFALQVIPAGMYVVSNVDGSLVLASDDPTQSLEVRVEAVGDESGDPPSSMGFYTPPGGTREIWYTFIEHNSHSDYIRIDVTGTSTFDIRAFATQLSSRDGNVLPLPVQ